MEFYNKQKRLNKHINYTHYAPEWIGAVLVVLIVLFLMLTAS